jgi:hypothetical protein
VIATIPVRRGGWAVGAELSILSPAGPWKRAARELVLLVDQEGPTAGLEIVDRLAREDYRYLHSTRGELLRRLGRIDEAGDPYRRALALVHDDAERRLLERRLANLGTTRSSRDLIDRPIGELGGARSPNAWSGSQTRRPS